MRLLYVAVIILSFYAFPSFSQDDGGQVMMTPEISNVPPPTPSFPSDAGGGGEEYDDSGAMDNYGDD